VVSLVNEIYLINDYNKLRISTTRITYKLYLANGYVRSEAIVALYIRKSTDAKRIYATIVGTSTNTDGFKIEGATYPSQSVQSQLIRETYAQANLNLNDVHYIEAHGTGTGVG